MLKSLNQIVARAEGSYLSAAQLNQLEQYHRSFAQRVQTYQAIQKLEGEILSELSRRLKKANPSWEQSFSSEDSAKCVRDSGNVLRNCTLAMLLDDKDYLYDHFLHWLKTIMVSLDHVGFHQQIYAPLKAVLKDKLTPSQANLLLPYLAYAQSVMA
jgi:hypothetical protein